MFSGTVRSNLDPFGEYGNDARLWEVLKDVGLEEQAKACGGLDAKLDGTGGQAWSLGQQQLMCLARAALKKVRAACAATATLLAIGSAAPAPCCLLAKCLYVACFPAAVHGAWPFGGSSPTRISAWQVPVLCLDEATAAMDPHTEAEVLDIIERLFDDRTTFTIAHRCAAAPTAISLPSVVVASTTQSVCLASVAPLVASASCMLGVKA